MRLVVGLSVHEHLHSLWREAGQVDTCEEAHDARGLSLPSQGDNDLVPTAYSGGWVWK